MKFYYSKANQKIISLNNLIEIKTLSWGTGAKSNPFIYAIEFRYFGGENARINCEKDATMAKTILEEVYEILSKGA